MSPSVVAHYVAAFLPVTEGWIHDQLRYARSLQSIVLTKRVINEDAFPWSPVYATEGSVRQELERLVRGFYPLHAAACRRHGVRLLHAHFGNRAVFARDLAAHLRIPLVASFYGRDLAGPANPDYDELFRSSERFLAEGPAARDRLIELGCPAAKIRIHRLGVDPDQIEFTPRCRKPDEPLRILMAGRFVEKKGFLHGVRAFCRATEAAPMHLSIVGDAGPDAAEQKIKQQLISAAESVRDRITFHGFLSHDQLLELARSHHVVMQPSVVAGNGDREGGHPVVLTVLAAAGMPAIATRHCDIPQIVIAGRTGWLCEERNETALASAMAEAFATDLAPMSRAAREHVVSTYDIREQTLDVAYEGLL